MMQELRIKINIMVRDTGFEPIKAADVTQISDFQRIADFHDSNMPQVGERKKQGVHVFMKKQKGSNVWQAQYELACRHRTNPSFYPHWKSPHPAMFGIISDSMENEGRSARD